MVNYCTISKCSNLGHHEGLPKNALMCSVYHSIEDIRKSMMDCWFFSPTHEDQWRVLSPKPNEEGYEEKLQYIEDSLCILSQEYDYVHSFEKLMYNTSCCELYVYVTDDNSKILKYQDYYYLFLEQDEIDELWKNK